MTERFINLIKIAKKRKKFNKKLEVEKSIPAKRVEDLMQMQLFFILRSWWIYKWYRLSIDGAYQRLLVKLGFKKIYFSSQK